MFDDDIVIKTDYKSFKTGKVKHPYNKTIFNVGYLGIGTYVAYKNYSMTECYRVWKDMLKRCYSLKEKQKRPTYKGCTVCEEWLNFQVFAEWYDNNYYEINNEKMCLDKDILHKGNKVYSPETCVFVPQRINTLFVKNDINRGDFPIGVTINSKSTYRATCRNQLINKQIHIGVYSTINDAFKSYKKYKENHIKEMADYYKNNIPKKLYNAMYNYIVEITD